MEKVTLEQIASTPATEYISTQFYSHEDFNMYCPFCGKRLIKHSEGWGRDKMTWYDDCDCEGAKKAEEHNARYDKLMAKQKSKSEKVKENASPVVSAPRRGPRSFQEIINLLKAEGLYVSHTKFGEPVNIDGIMIGYMSDMHKKIVVIDDDTTFNSYNWDLCISFMSEKDSQNPIMRVVQALANCGRPYQHLVVTDVKKAKKVLESLF